MRPHEQSQDPIVTTTMVPNVGSSLSIDIDPDGSVSVYGDAASVIVALRELGLCPDGNGEA